MQTLEIAMNPLKPNERIVYKHPSKNIIKHGVFVRKVKHPRKYWQIFHRRQLAVVKFIGNDNETRVEHDRLERPS